VRLPGDSLRDRIEMACRGVMIGFGVAILVLFLAWAAAPYLSELFGRSP
jgi:hypothetical protein